ncbi:Hemolysin secretion protein D, chromosomal [invertebrate metagenome]|uniref:Hemolysin secretion protein D, chromosomal n=1 Tax=invertebrate metagenome TaxID=1711999 RepID=A0A2H9T657_9ZZZZ
MTIKQSALTSCLLLAVLLVSSLYIPIEVFTRAEGEVVPFHPLSHADFPDDGVLLTIRIEEGSYVEKGAVIAELDNREMKLNLQILHEKQQQMEKKLALLNGLLDEQLDNDTIDEVAFNDQIQRFVTLQKNYRDNVDNLESLVNLDTKKNAAMQQLVKKNVAGALQADDSMQKLLRNKKDLLKARKEFEERIIFDIERYEERQRDIVNTIQLNKLYIEKTLVFAPVSGIVRHIYYPAEGSFVSQGDKFADIIESSDSPFKIRLFVAPSDIGMIEENDDVVIRVDTYDHSVFGTIEGKISQISLDRTHEHRNERFYRIMVTPHITHLSKGGEAHSLKYGMTLYATIERGTVSLMSYLMKPVIKHFHEVGHL